MLSTLGGNTVRVFDATLFENLPEKKNRLARTRTPSKVNTCVCVFLGKYRDTGNVCGSHLELFKLELNCQ